MNLIRSFLLVILAFSNLFGLAQNTDQVKKRGPSDEYARSSMSYLLLDFQNEKYSSMLNAAINTTSVPSKFDNNNLSKKTLTAPYYHGPESQSTAKNGEKIRQTLVAENFAIDVIKCWWNIQDDGSYSTKLIEKRGEYNATDEVVSTVDASKVGRAKLGDLGLKLIGNSFVMVLDYEGVQSMDDIYNEQDAAARKAAEEAKTEFVPVKRVKNGFVGKITSYLYKINYSDTVQGYFDAAFIDEKQIDLNKLNTIFSNVYTPLILTTTETQKIEATQANPGEPLASPFQQTPEQLMVKFVNTGISKTLDKIETRFEAFRVKAPVTNVDPIKAKIGRKESLKHERRYFVWQYVETSSGGVIPKKKGVVRAQKVVDNQNNELGNTSESTFYQIGGGKIGVGMTLHEAKDLGIGAGIGYGTSGLVIRADLNVGQWGDIPVRQLKLYGELITGSKEYTDAAIPNGVLSFPDDNMFSQTKFAIGILKERPFARNFRYGWQIGYTGETITWESTDSGQSFSAGGLNWGLRLGMNLFSPSFHVIGSINGHHYGEITYKSGEEGVEDAPLGISGSDIFPSKTPISFDLSLRLSF